MTTPKATHSGEWVIDEPTDLRVQCYVMDNDERVLSLRGASRSMGLSSSSGAALTRNLNTQWLSPYLSEPLREWLYRANRNENTQYLTERGTRFIPFEASLFVDLCKAYVDAKNDGALPTESFKIVADRMYHIMTAFAKVGLIAVIDEVTGYQEDRDRSELQKILSNYISPELLPWTRRFPDEFYRQIFRLRGWSYKGNPKPPYVGKLTNQIIYQYLPDGVLAELRKKNPSTSGRRQKKHHQFLSVDTGVVHLDNQLQQSMALMKASDDWDEFEALLKKAMGEPHQTTLDLPDE